MSAALRCPNPSCGRTSQLGEDPLGRIFRCPRCLTKFPTGAAALSDSGWTDVLGPLPRRYSAAPVRQQPVDPRLEAGAGLSVRRQDSSRLQPGAFPESCGRLSAESEEFWAGSFDSHAEVMRRNEHSELVLVESGEVVIAPFSHEIWSDAELGAQGAMAAVSTARRLGRFEIIEVLGEGRHSTVYRAFDPLLERQVALKRPRQAITSNSRALDRFLGEARALAQLRHPRIVPIYEAGYDRGFHYIAMELIEGQSLAERIAEEPLPFHRVAEIILELAEALAHTHALGIVHRDIKPANIRLDRDGVAYLMDFGIAYRPESGEVPLPPGIILGTPAYVSPEQAKGGQPDIFPASDQYSLGAVLYELLCGKPPFLGPPSCVLFHTIHHQPMSPRSVRHAVPRSLDAICRRAMAKQPERRYASCQVLADELRRWLNRQTNRRLWSFLPI